MGLQVYRILAEVAEQQSFSKAAERLHLTRSAVSHAVVKLERECGFALFLRTGASVQPTEEGRRLLPEIFGLLRMEEDLRGQVAGIRAGVGERVRLGVFGSFSARYLSALAAAFCAKFPAVELSVLQGSPAEVAEWVRGGGADLGVTAGPLPCGLQCFPLFADEICCALPPGSGAGARGYVTEEELQELRFLQCRREHGAESVQPAQSPGAPAIDPAGPNLDGGAVFALVQAGQGAAFCSRLALSAWPQPFAAYPLKPPAYREICLVCADGAALSQAARWLKDHIAAFFEDGQGPGPDAAG